MASLFYHAGALGDFLTALPAVRAWRLAHPREKVILLGKPSYGILACRSGYFDEVWDVESASNAWLFSAEPVLPAIVREKYSHVNTAVLFAAPNSPIVLRLSAAGVKNIYSQTPFPERRIPVALYHLSLFPQATYLLDHFGPIIHSDPAFQKDAENLLNGLDEYIVVHPGSGSGIKNWPFENFMTFANACRRYGFTIVWIYGEAERDLPEATGFRVIRNASLPVVVHVLKMGSAYIGNDSGISHLAAGAGCRATVLFGPSDDVVWGPCGAHVTIVKAGRLCGPCHPGRNTMSRCKDSCMRRLSVEEVVEAFLRNVR